MSKAKEIKTFEEKWENTLDEAIKNNIRILKEYKGLCKGDTFEKGGEKFILGGYSIMFDAFNVYPIERYKTSKSSFIHGLMGVEKIKKYRAGHDNDKLITEP